MSKKAVKILILVEGEKTDIALMSRLFDIYGLSSRHQIVSYKTNIYDLYHRMFFENDPDALDLLQVLKEHEKNENIKQIFDDHYSDIILIFDLDPQDPDYTPEIIRRMADYFSESSDHGKLYLNYPMIESFYHMRTIPDPDFDSCCVTMEELSQRTYKSRVKQLCRIPYKSFATSKQQYDIIISQNLNKAAMINGMETASLIPFDTSATLAKQLSCLQDYEKLYVLCTCIFYIIDYNPDLLCLHCELS